MRTERRRAAIRTIDAGQQPQQRRLPDAVDADQRGARTVVERQRQAVEQRRAVVGLREVVGLEHAILSGIGHAGAEQASPRSTTPPHARPVVVGWTIQCGGLATSPRRRVGPRLDADKGASRTSAGRDLGHARGDVPRQPRARARGAGVADRPRRRAGGDGARRRARRAGRGRLSCSSPTTATARRSRSGSACRSTSCPDVLPDSPFSVLKIDMGFWKERALWWPEQRGLIVPESIGTATGLRGRPWPGRHPPVPAAAATLFAESFLPEHLLVGHGGPLHDDAAAALLDALNRSRRDIPTFVLQAPSMIRRMRNAAEVACAHVHPRPRPRRRQPPDRRGR